MSRRYAELVSPDQDPYDVLLDEYEEGADQELYDRVLLPLSEPIGRLIKQHIGATQDSSYSIAIDDRPTFKSFVEELCEQV
jgi:Zn-dependent M32 family carboxypeptidase